MTQPAPATVLFLNGTVGAGKTTIAMHLHEMLSARGVRHAVIDLDELRRSWPAPDDDPFDHELELRNLAAVAHNYWAAGASRMILAGVIEEVSEISRYVAAVGRPIVFVRLTASDVRVRERLVARHVTDAAGLKWHLDRAGELAGILDRSGLDDHVVDTDGHTPGDVADLVIDLIGW